MKIKEGMVIHCDTEKKADKLLNKLHDLGYAWNTGRSLMNIECDNYYGDKTCYMIKKNKNITTANLGYFLQEGDEITKFDDLKWADETGEIYEFEPTKEFLEKHGDEYVVEFKEEMKFIAGDISLKYVEDIIKIYKLTPVWTREEAKKMTLQEIEEALGYKIKLREE